MTKRIRKGQEKSKKNEDIWTPKDKKRPWKWASQNSTTIYFLHNKWLCAACYSCHNPWQSKVLNVAISCFEFYVYS